MSLRTHNLCSRTGFVLNSTDLCEHRAFCVRNSFLLSLFGGELQASLVKVQLVSVIHLKLIGLVHLPLHSNTLTLLPQCKHSLVFLLLPFLRYICIYIYLSIYLCVYICNISIHTQICVYTHKHHWQSFLCGLKQGLNNYLQFNRSALPKLVIFAVTTAV